MRIRRIVFILPAVFLALALAGGSELLLRLFFLSALLPIVCYVWTVFGIRGISVQAENPPEHCQVGERFQQEITISNSSRIPKLWLKVEQNSDMPRQRDATVLNVFPGGSCCWRTSVHCQHRGRYNLGSVAATATDPFGLFSRERNFGEPRSILVYPATFDLPLFRLSSFSDFGHGSGYQSIGQISPNASSVREFTTGDSLRHIHWHSTAHTDKLMVKVFDPDRSYNGSKTVWVVLDMDRTSHLGEGEESTEEYGVTIAASLIRKHLGSGMRVGMVASSDQSHLFPPEREKDSLWSMLEALALMKATGNVPVGQLISENIERFRGNSVIIVTPSATDELADITPRLVNRTDSVAAILLDTASFGGNTGATSAARNPNLAGVKVYVVRKGDDLARALDSRFSPLRT